MQESQCPLCFGPLEVREVAPCHECGGEPGELEHFRAGTYTFAEYEVFPGQPLTLCNFCDVDFGSYDPAFFGLPPHTKLGYQYMRRLRPVDDPSLGTDKYCPRCGYRLRFLRFVAQSRQQHGC
jgi:hypothetical protein